MNKNYLNKLEYMEIIQILANYCYTYLGKELCSSLTPSAKVDEVSNLLEETNQAIKFYYQYGNLQFSEISNISPYLKHLNNKGTLSIKALLDILQVLSLSKLLKNHFYSETVEVQNFTLLDKLFSNLYTNQNLLETLSKSILDEQTLADNASSGLMAIRKKQRNLEKQIKEKLDLFIHSPKYAKYIQEPIITIRNERYVIPVKEEHQNNIKGLVHDRSSSGSTLFIEPLSVFELNNEIQKLKVEEENEILSILNNLSVLIFPHTQALQTTLNIIGKLDFIFAKANYAIKTNGIIPLINKEPKVELLNARHPLILDNKVVPISIKLDSSTSTIVITGPNTGGKTVTLKTVRIINTYGM